MKKTWVKITVITIIASLLCQDITLADFKLAQRSLFSLIKENRRGREVSDNEKIKFELLDLFLKDRRTRESVFSGSIPKVKEALAGFFGFDGSITIENRIARVKVELDGKPAFLYFLEKPLECVNKSMGINNEKDLEIANRRLYWFEFLHYTPEEIKKAFREKYGEEIRKKTKEDKGYRVFAERNGLSPDIVYDVVYEREMEFCGHILGHMIEIFEKLNSKAGRKKKKMFVVNASMLYDVDETIGTINIKGWHIRPSIPFLFRFLLNRFNIRIGICSTREEEDLRKELVCGNTENHSLSEIAEDVSRDSVYSVRSNSPLVDKLYGRLNLIFPGFRIFNPEGGGIDVEVKDRHLAQNKEAIAVFTDRISKIIGIKEEDDAPLEVLCLRLAAAKEEIDRGAAEVAVVIDNAPYTENLYQLFMNGIGGNDGYELFGLEKYRDRLFVMSCGERGEYEADEIRKEAERRRPWRVRGCIAQDEKLIGEFKDALNRNEVETEEISGEKINLISLLFDVLRCTELTASERAVLERIDNEIPHYKIELFDESKWIRGLDSFVLGFNDRERGKILLSRRLYEWIKDEPSLINELLIHELICSPLCGLYESQGKGANRGHYRAIEIQQKACLGNYEQGSFTEKGGYKYIADGGKLFKGRLGYIFRFIIDDKFNKKATVLEGILSVLGEERLRKEFRRGILYFLYEDPVCENIHMRDLKGLPEIIQRIRYVNYDFFTNPTFAETVVSFAKAILDKEEFRGKKILVLDRAGDLIYDALYGLVHIFPQYRDRIPDIKLIDFSYRDGFKKAMCSNPRVIGEYIESQGINRQGGVVIVNELACGPDEFKDGLVLKDILINTLGYPKDKVMTALMHSEREYIRGIESNSIDFVYTNELLKLGNIQDAEKARDAAEWLAFKYKSGRKYNVSYTDGKLKFKYEFPLMRHYFSWRFIYKCRIYREIMDLVALVEEIKNTGSGESDMDIWQRAEKLKALFEKRIVPRVNANQIFSMILTELAREPNSDNALNLIIIAVMFFTKIPGDGREFRISKKEYYRLWDIYDRLDKKCMFAGIIENIFLYDNVKITGDPEKKEVSETVKERFAVELISALNDERGDDEEYVKETYSIYYIFRDILKKKIEERRDGKPNIYDEILAYLFFGDKKDIEDARGELAEMVVRHFRLNIDKEIQEPVGVCEEIFGDEERARKFYEMASLLRVIYPYRISEGTHVLHTLDERGSIPPIDYARGKGIIFEIGRNLYITPVTGSFRRHLIFKQDTGGNIEFGFEVIIPGERPERRCIEGKKRYDIANDLLRNGQGAEYCARTVYYRKMQNGVYSIYGRRFEYDDKEPLEVVAFDFDGGGQRLGTLRRKDLERIASELGITVEKVCRDIAIQIAEILARLHSLGYIGHYESLGWDVHTGNFRIVRTESSIMIKLVGDFGSFARKKEFKDPDKEMNDDFINLLCFESGLNKLTLPKLLRINDLELKSIFNNARKKYRLKSFTRSKPPCYVIRISHGMDWGAAVETSV